MKVGDRVEVAGGTRGLIIEANVGAFGDRWLVRWTDGVCDGHLSQMPTQDIQVVGILDLIAEAVS